MTAPRIIPQLEPQQAGETAPAYGRRALQFLISEELSAAALDTDAIELAYHVSTEIVIAPALTERTRDTFAALRADLLRTMARRQEEKDRATWTRPETPSQAGGPSPTAPVPTHPAPTQPPSPDALPIPIMAPRALAPADVARPF